MRLRDNYRQAVKKFQPKPPYIANSLKAFLIGGGLSVVAEVMRVQFRTHMPPLAAEQVVLLLFIGAAVLFTAMGVYDDFSQFAGAGLTALITGFANSLTSAAMEHRSEGLVNGIAAHMFKIGGAALVYGIIAAYLFGLVHFMR